MRRPRIEYIMALLLSVAGALAWIVNNEFSGLLAVGLGVVMVMLGEMDKKLDEVTQ